ncbi:prephenate dehydratase [Ochrobactrum sp. RH1CCR137]|nr:prephenate dehydratase [Ochrobactrum sp. RH1CCR137]MBA8854842.1 prephenate dehydratase [Ochrobactrum sp. RH1CCR134]MBM7323158.1 Tn3 family transposase [Agrobacterium sp. S2]QNQ39435.1 Tn3 family transposase [Brucella intermedia]
MLIPIREQLLALLEETADDRVTRFVWLRQFEPGSNSSSANRLLDRLEYLQRVDLPENLLAHVSPLGWEHINLTGEYRWPKP